MFYTIRQLTKKLRVTARALRHYEEMKLIAPSRNGATRLYSFHDYARILILLRGRRLGYTVKEMRDVLQMYEYTDGNTEHQLLAARSKFVRRIAELRAKRNDIDESLEQLSECVDKIDAALVGRPRAPWHQFFAHKMTQGEREALQ